jgi:hypothetical protein
MALISTEVRRLLDPRTEHLTEAELQRLRTEVTSPRRLLPGAASVALGVLGGFGAGFAGAELAAGRGSGALAALGLALALLVPAAVLAVAVIRAGRRVVTGYVQHRAAAPASGPAHLARSVLGPGLVLRSALAAAGVIASCFAASLLWLAWTGPSYDAATAAMGAVWLTTALVATGSLLSGELRVVRAEGRRTRA